MAIVVTIVKNTYPKHTYSSRDTTRREAMMMMILFRVMKNCNETKLTLSTSVAASIMAENTTDDTIL